VAEAPDPIGVSAIGIDEPETDLTEPTSVTDRVTPWPPVADPALDLGGPAASPRTVVTPSVASPVPRRSEVSDRPRRVGRRVKRVVRRVELWSVLKLSLVLFTCLYVALLLSLAAIWGIAYSSGQIENLQEFLADVGLENFRFYGDQMFRACAAIGAVLVLAGTVVTVLTAALVNVISEMTGGIRLVVIEEDVAPPPRRPR